MNPELPRPQTRPEVLDVCIPSTTAPIHNSKNL